ncbi:MAG: hypothetical protein JRH20_30540 [Deltaproteobacteria bacterium]|nr:hypothetical protein [Deltaproteobacteria bacterium]
MGLLCSGCPDTELKRLGDVCVTDEECVSSRCDELVCKSATPRESGDFCSHPLECRSERCVGGECVLGPRASALLGRMMVGC